MSRAHGTRPRRQGGADRRGAADHGEDRTTIPAACRSRCSTAFAPRSRANRAQFYLDVPTGPFYGFNRPGAKVSQGVIDNWWRQGMMGGTKAHYDCIKAFSETDFTEDLKTDRRAGARHARRRRPDRALSRIRRRCRSSCCKNGTLKIYKGLPHGMCTTHPDVINPDLLAFIKG